MDPTAEVTPTETDVARICAIANPLVRNLQITDCYARLSRAFAARTGQRANWCTFATWASRQAGRTIRGEDLGDTLRRRLHTPARLSRPLEAIWRWLLRRGLLDPGSRLGRVAHEIHTPFDAFERSSDAVARGNLKVFEEIAREFARYLRLCPADVAVSSEAFIAWLSALRPGDPPDGQDQLVWPFRTTSGSRMKPTRVRAPGSCCWPISASDSTSRIASSLRSRKRWMRRSRLLRTSETACSARSCPRLTDGRPCCASPPRVRSGGWPHACVSAAVRLSREVITERLMVLTLPPDVVLSLGHDLEVPVPAVLAGAHIELQTRRLPADLRSMPARTVHLRRAGLVRSAATHAFHPAPVPRVPGRRSPLREAVHGRTGTGVRARRGSRGNAVTPSGPAEEFWPGVVPESQ